MYWKFDWNAASPEADAPRNGRFVLHRHRDHAGPHLDLRLEQEGFLSGWRLEGESLETAGWGTSKLPHPAAWLDQDGDALREDAGEFAWRAWDGATGILELRGEKKIRCCRVTPVQALPARCAAEVAALLESRGRGTHELPALLEDGLTARERSVARLCALGKELDGPHFDEAAWRQLTASMALRDIDQHLHGFEVRFDAKYPPQPVSMPENLDAPEPGLRGRAWSILSGA